jgi:penicillin-binding protein 1C
MRLRTASFVLRPGTLGRLLVRGSQFAAGVLALVVGWIFWPLPAHLLPRDSSSGVVIEDRDGLPLRSTRASDGSQARWVAYERVDPDLINAFVAVEDQRFWEHSGVDVIGVARAARDNLRARDVVSGASTITMQLARLLRPVERTWGGKLAQALWALRLERHLDKQQILEQYLNRVHLGQATVGVGAASALYFGAAASELSVGQAATLAGLAHAPSRDNPYASPRHARERRRYALRQMWRRGYTTRDEIARAREEPIVAARSAPPFLAPHFTTRVLAWAGSDSSPSSASVRTSLDRDLQQALESEVRHTVDVLRHRGVVHAAAVVLDNASGEVLAWIGSPDFWAPAGGQTDMVISARQPGSALKPFLYGLALDRGYTAASVLPDIPKSYATATGSYTPRNYDRRFRGPVRAREALASSYNVPAVELAAHIGTGSLLHTLRLAGFESLQRDAEHYGLGLALGNGDVTLIELANGYRALANGGAWRPWTWRPAAGSGQPAEGGEARRVLSPVASAIVLDILHDPAARIPGFGTSTAFDFPFPVAVKTGTSRHFTDNWAVATTRRFTVAVWAGNFSGRPMQGVSGVTGAGPLLHRAVMITARHLPPGMLTTPDEVGAVSAPVCRLSGMRATAQCAQLTEWFAVGTVPTQTDDWERGGRLALPDEYAEWAHEGLRPVADGVTLAAAEQETHSAPAPDSARARAPVARFRILSPLDGDRYAIPTGIETRYATISFRAGGVGAESVQWLVDGKPFAGGRWPLAPGRHVVRALSAEGTAAEARIVVIER